MMVICVFGCFVFFIVSFLICGVVCDVMFGCLVVCVRMMSCSGYWLSVSFWCSLCWLCLNILFLNSVVCCCG